MKKTNFLILACIMALSLNSCKATKDLKADVYETSAAGNALKKLEQFSDKEYQNTITFHPPTHLILFYFGRNLKS